MSLLRIAVLLGVSASLTSQAGTLSDDAKLTKLADWHLGFTTNIAQHDADIAAGANPRWALSELRFHQIWSHRDDGYWLYYETSQPDVRPDRNEIWRLYRNDQGDLKVDIYQFNDVQAGLAMWGKGGDPEAFDSVSLNDISTRAGCNATYHWREEFERFVGVNAHGECTTIGDSYLLQHVEISKTESGKLVRRDWHVFYDENGIAKRGEGYKFGDQGPYIHIYLERFALKPPGPTKP